LLANPDVPRYHLTTNHRTRGDGVTETLVAQANALVLDRTYQFRLQPGGNIFWYDAAPSAMEQLLTSLHDQGFSAWDCTVLSPYRDLRAINDMCQAVFNGTSLIERRVNGITWRVGDRVMLLKNLRDVDLANVEEGEVIGVDDSGVTVNFGETTITCHWTAERDGDDDMVESDALSVAQLTHSWALTVHKAQGSEWPVVVAYIPKASSFVTRELLYVMLTRTVNWLFIFATEWALVTGLNNVTPANNCDFRLAW